MIHGSPQNFFEGVWGWGLGGEEGRDEDLSKTGHRQRQQHRPASTIRKDQCCQRRLLENLSLVVDLANF